MARLCLLIGVIVVTISSEVNSLPQGPQPDIINLFFHSSFQKLDEYFQVTEDDTDAKDVTGREGESETTKSRGWKYHVSKAILKILLIIVTLICTFLFAVTVMFTIALFFALLKCVTYTCKYCTERYPCKARLCGSSSYGVSI